MTLVQSHLEDLKRSGLCDETIARAGIYSAPERQVRDLLGYGVGPGMVIPYPSPADARVRLDHPDKDGKRYRSPSKVQNRLYVPPTLDPKRLADVSFPLFNRGRKEDVEGRAGRLRLRRPRRRLELADALSRQVPRRAAPGVRRARLGRARGLHRVRQRSSHERGRAEGGACARGVSHLARGRGLSHPGCASCELRGEECREGGDDHDVDRRDR